MIGLKSYNSSRSWDNYRTAWYILPWITLITVTNRSDEINKERPGN